MQPLLHDLTDLRLARVAPQVDARLDEMSELDPTAVGLRVAFDTDRAGSAPEQRARDVVASVTRLLNLHGWHVVWHDRGLRLSHGAHSIVLGCRARCGSTSRTEADLPPGLDAIARAG